MSANPVQKSTPITNPWPWKLRLEALPAETPFCKAKAEHVKVTGLYLDLTPAEKIWNELWPEIFRLKMKNIRNISLGQGKRSLLHGFWRETLINDFLSVLIRSPSSLSRKILHNQLWWSWQTWKSVRTTWIRNSDTAIFGKEADDKVTTPSNSNGGIEAPKFSIKAWELKVHLKLVARPGEGVETGMVSTGVYLEWDDALRKALEIFNQNLDQRWQGHCIERRIVGCENKGVIWFATALTWNESWDGFSMGYIEHNGTVCDAASGNNYSK